MKNNETIFDYFAHTLIIFGFTILWMVIFSILFGESAQGYSSLFSMGSQGLSLATILQFLLISVIISALRFIFFTDRLIKKLSVTLRTIYMFALILIMMVVFILLFDWFPVNDSLPWVMFFICFGLSAIVSAGITAVKENMENRTMEKALQRLKAEQNATETSLQ